MKNPDRPTAERRTLLTALVAAILIAHVPAALAQGAWPARPITMIVPQAAGLTAIGALPEG